MEQDITSTCDFDRIGRAAELVSISKRRYWTDFMYSRLHKREVDFFQISIYITFLHHEM